MTLLSEMANVPEEQALKLLDDMAKERKASPKLVLNGRAYIQAAKLDENKLVGEYTTSGGRKVIVAINSTNPAATLKAGKKPTKSELKLADDAAEHVEVVRMTDPSKDENDPEAQLPEEV